MVAHEIGTGIPDTERDGDYSRVSHVLWCDNAWWARQTYDGAEGLVEISLKVVKRNQGGVQRVLVQGPRVHGRNSIVLQSRRGIAEIADDVQQYLRLLPRDLAVEGWPEFVSALAVWRFEELSRRAEIAYEDARAEEAYAQHIAYTSHDEQAMVDRMAGRAS